MSEVKYPEAEKWGKAHDSIVAIIQFTEWKEYTYPDGTRKSLEELCAEFYDVDYKELENERRAMLEALNA